MAQSITVLTYHDISADPGADPYTLSRSRFVSHMDYLQQNGYQPISLAQLEEYRKHPQRMPAKPVLLTFDDGLSSYYEFVVPVLKTYRFPSVAGVVTGWLDGKNLPSEYHGKLMTWDQLRELSRLSLVEIVTHTHDLHHGIQSNPQGSQEAASVTRQYLTAEKRYEAEEVYRLRVKIDMQHSINRLQKELGVKPLGVVWPYGMYDKVLSDAATELGLHYQFSLDSGPTTLSDLPHVNRIMLMRDTSVEDLAVELSYSWMAAETRRFTVLNLDPFLQADTLEKQEHMFSELLDRLEPLGLNMVVLSPFSSDNTQAFYPNPEIPLGQDVLRRTAHLLQNKLRIRHIYLQLPAELPGKNLTPTYSELARLIRFDGVVFQAGTDAKTAGFIKQLLNAVRPKLQYGVFASDNKNVDTDFVIARIDTQADIAKNRIRIAEFKGMSAHVYWLSKQTYDINNVSLPALTQSFNAINARHFGFQLNTEPLVSVLHSIDAPEPQRSAAGG